MPNEELPEPMPTTNEDELRAVTVGEPQRLDGNIHIAEYDPAWPAQFAVEANKIREALGAGALLLEHVGSTSVPGLAAKPILDILLVVANSADESLYVPALERAGYVLRIREPVWYEHRVLKGTDPAVNLHVFSPDCLETERMLLMRDWLRTHPEDRELYEQTKRQLAQESWQFVQNYADAKTGVVEGILARARAAGA
jgi:GrpB-like predicted nucleotidyltransferase (UPF0157 family)